jgi:hypothetical protein
MSTIRKCHNENCENNVEGAYCNACEVVISEDGVCESYYPKTKEVD